jgi:hypothetical protein
VTRGPYHVAHGIERKALLSRSRSLRQGRIDGRPDHGLCHSVLRSPAMNESRRKPVSSAALLTAVLSLLFGVSGCRAQLTSDSRTTPPSIPPPAPTPAPVPSSVTVTLCSGPEASCGQASSFPVSSTRDLVAHVHWMDVPTGIHTQRVRFVLPEGAIYQERELPLRSPLTRQKRRTFRTDSRFSAVLFLHVNSPENGTSKFISTASSCPRLHWRLYPRDLADGTPFPYLISS